MSSRNIIYYSIWIVVVLLIGCGSVWFFVAGAGNVSNLISEKTNSFSQYIHTFSPKTSPPVVAVATDASTKPFEIKLENIPDGSFVPVTIGKEIRANLTTMTIQLYEDGKVVNTLPIINKGKSGSYWETPGGLFQVSYKEQNHFSKLGNIWMPNSIHFFGNFFIHGQPYDNSGKKYSSSYPIGCIQLSDKDSAKVFAWTDATTLVSIYSDSTKDPTQLVNDSAYFIRDPDKKLDVTAKAYAVTDLDTGEIILEKNGTKQYPIASVSKLTTSLVALANLKQTEEATVSRSAIAAYGTSGSLHAGEQLSVGTLLYPLILESSNDAAEVLAEHDGRSTFIAKMNDFVKSLGMTQTHYKDPSGLSPENVSTPEDLLKLAEYVRSFKSSILDISKLSKKVIEDHTWYNNSKLTNAVGYLGGKSGYTPEAENTIVAMFSVPLSELGNRNIGIAFLQSTGRIADLNKILAYLKSNVYYSARDQAEAILATTQSGIVLPPAPPATEEVTLGFLGDIMMDRGVAASVAKNFDGDFNKLFANLSFIRDYDIAFANLEGPVSDLGYDKQNLYSFRMGPRVLPVLSGAGFDALSVANNHIGDWGMDAFTDTLNRLKSAGIEAVGGGNDKATAEQPRIIEKNGVKIGFIGFSDVGPDSLAATDTEPGILLANDPRFAEIISNASKQVDDLVVSIHWGEEYKDTTDRQRTLAHTAIDAGARLVIGTHPHIIQETESYKDGYIAYSLGNLIFDQAFSKNTMRGLLLEVTLKKNEIAEVHKRVVQMNSKFQPDKIIDEE